uniref:Uncharacterized protein n=1 Tax=Arundo donax TaxID=35708 RepID=A0A0A8Z0F6_ARUDO
MANVATQNSFLSSRLKDSHSNQFESLGCHVEDEAVDGFGSRSRTSCFKEVIVATSIDNEMYYDDYDGDESDSVDEQHQTPHIIHDFVVGYSSFNDAPWQRYVPLNSTASDPFVLSMRSNTFILFFRCDSIISFLL